MSKLYTNQFGEFGKKKSDGSMKWFPNEPSKIRKEDIKITRTIDSPTHPPKRGIFGLFGRRR